MSLKKILAVVMASAMAIGAFAAHALTLDVAESANEAVVAEEAALAEEEISAWADVADTSWYNTADASFTVDTAAEFAGLATGTEINVSFPFKDESTVRRLCANMTEGGGTLEIRNVEYSDECTMNIVCQKEFYEAFVKKVTDTLAGCVTVEKKDETTMLIKE